MNIEDILAEWERMKRENAEKGEEEVRRHVLEQTGDMFTEFEASVRDGLLEKIENSPDTDEPEETAEEETSEALDTDGIGEVDELEEIKEETELEPETSEEPEVEEEEPEAEDEPETSEDTEVGLAEPEAEAEPETSEEPKPEPQQTEASVERDKAKPRPLTRDEKELYAPYIQSKSARRQLVNVIDNISMAAYTGNVILTGEEGTDTITLAKNIVREVKNSDSNFSGRIAKITGKSLNNKNVADTVEQLANGALIIEKATWMSNETETALYQSLQQENHGIIVIIEDIPRAMDRFLTKHSELLNSFTNRMDVEALNNDTLVEFGRQYAHEREYSIDDFGILALHTRIEERQTLNHAVTVMDVKELIDKAIKHANKKTVGHFVDILFAKRYDDEDMIILGEKDFN
jgi:outer membrane biosynthesis protein TonB